MATITAAAGGGNWSVGGTWVGGVVPTAADDVLLTGASGNVTIDTPAATCRSLDCTGYVGTLTIAGTNNLSIGNASGGSLKLSVGMTIAVGASGTFTFVSTSDNGGSGWSITTAGKALPAVAFNGVGGKWKLLDAFTLSGARTITFTAGHLDTNGMSVTASIFSSSGTGVRSLTLGASVLTLTGTSSSWLTTTSTNLTMTPNTATINLTGSNVNLSAGSLNFQGSSVVLSGSGTADLSAGFTVANLSRVGTAVRTDVLRFTGDATITGTFTVTGNSVTNRVLVSSNFFGTQRTVTAAVVAFTNVDFTDIAIAGAAAAAPVGVSVGDALGNSGITFTASATQTRVGAGGNWSDVASWTSRVPLPQDDVIVGAAASGTITMDMPRMGRSVDLTGFAGTVNTTIAASIYGSLTLAAAAGWTTSTVINTLTFRTRSAATLTTNGKAIGTEITLLAPGGTVTMQDALTLSGVSGGLLLLTAGTWNANGFDVTMSSTSNTGRLTLSGATLLMGGGVWRFAATAASSFWNVTSGVVVHGGSVIELTSVTANTRSFIGGGQAYGTLRYTVAASTGALVITGANTFDGLDVQGGGRTLTFPAGTVTTIVSLLRLLGTNAGSLLTVNSSTGGTKAILSVPATAASDVQFASITDNDADGTATPLIAYDSTLANTTDWLAVDRKSASDSIDVDITATVLAAASLAASDALDVSIDDAASSLLVAAAGTDTVDIDVADTSELSNLAAAADSVDVDITEAAVLAATLEAADDLDVELAELTAQAGLVDDDDTLDVSIDDAGFAEWLLTMGCMDSSAALLYRMAVTLTSCEGVPVDEAPEVGSVVRVHVAVTSEATGLPVDPTFLYLLVERPDRTTYTPDPIVHTGVGTYYADIIVTASGQWTWRWWSEGIGQAAKRGAFLVPRQTVGV